MVDKKYIILALLFLTSCSVVSVSKLENSLPNLFTIDYEYYDDVENEKLWLSFTNTYSETICIGPEDWPNEFCGLQAPDDNVFLIINDRQFARNQQNLGYCPGCGIKVTPGESMTGCFDYEDFELPVNLKYEKKELVYKAMAGKCWEKVIGKNGKVLK